MTDEIRNSTTGTPADDADAGAAAAANAPAGAPSGGMSRRDMLRRTALAGGALVVASGSVQTIARPAFADTPVLDLFSNFLLIITLDDDSTQYAVKFQSSNEQFVEGGFPQGNFGCDEAEGGFKDRFETAEDNDLQMAIDCAVGELFDYDIVEQNGAGTITITAEPADGCNVSSVHIVAAAVTEGGGFCPDTEGPEVCEPPEENGKRVCVEIDDSSATGSLVG